MSAVARIPKPQMRGLLQSYLKTSLIISGVSSIAAALGYHFLISVPRKNTYAEFHRTYDPEAAFERMKSRGVFQACS